MSIQDELNSRCAEGRLFYLPLARTNLQTVRYLFVSPELYRFVATGPWENKAEEKRGGFLRADLDDFTRGAILTVEWNPFEARAAYFGRLDPTTAEVWDIRSRDPRPGIRVLGSFADKDTFVCLLWFLRKEWEDRHCRKWRDARVQASTEWRNLFPSYETLKGENIHDYLSNAVLA